MFDFIRSRQFVTQLAIIVAVIGILLFGTYRWLNAYTNHGETVTVPDLRGMKFTELDKFLEGKSIKVKVSDSTVFMLDKPPGVVIEQDPVAGQQVKENRTVYLTITRAVPPQVKLPNLIDVSRRQAEAILASYGLQVGQVTYRPDLAKDAVLSISVDGKEIKAGTELPKGSTIDLILGDGLGNTTVKVPSLVGLSLEEAMFVLQGSQLNAGALIFDETVRDTTQAKVYRQSPATTDSVTMKQGEPVDLYLTQSNSKL